MEPPNRLPRFGFLALVVGCVAILVAAVVLVWTSVTTASARFAGSTANESSLFTAASDDVIVGNLDDPTALTIDGDGLYPGRVIERCIPVTFRGSLEDVKVRLIGQSNGGTGLDNFIETTLEVGSGADLNCSDFAAERTAFQGSLADLWLRHGEFTTGLDIMESAADGDTSVMRIAVEVVSDDAAQGLTSEFSMLIEARP